MNCLSINCSVEAGYGKLVVVTLTDNGAERHIFRSPSVFSFKANSAEILNWHRDNIISLVTQFEIQAIVVKKTERTSFFSKPKNKDIFKLYVEGVMLSLAGSIGKLNKHLYKRDIQTILQQEDIFESSIESICKMYAIECGFPKILKSEVDTTKEALLAVIALRKITQP